MNRVRLSAVFLAMAVLGAACSDSGDAAGTGQPGASVAESRPELTISWSKVDEWAIPEDFGVVEIASTVAVLVPLDWNLADLGECVIAAPGELADEFDCVDTKPVPSLVAAIVEGQDSCRTAPCEAYAIAGEGQLTIDFPPTEGPGLDFRSSTRLLPLSEPSGPTAFTVAGPLYSANRYLYALPNGVEMAVSVCSRGSNSSACGSGPADGDCSIVARLVTCTVANSTVVAVYGLLTESESRGAAAHDADVRNDGT